jgi:hypothetical protein
VSRIPVRDIQFNTTATTPQPKKSHVGVVARAVISTIAALVLFETVIHVFIWYRRRQNIRRSSRFSDGIMETFSGAEVTPFVSSYPAITHEHPMTWTEWQQAQSGLPATVATDADAYSSSSGLHSQSPTPVPVGLSAKELARMRAENLRPRPAIDAITVAPSLPATATEQSHSSTSPSLFRTLQSQVDRLWREIRQLQVRAETPERSGSEAPPSYAEHDGGGQS